MWSNAKKSRARKKVQQSFQITVYSTVTFTTFFLTCFVRRHQIFLKLLRRLFLLTFIFQKFRGQNHWSLARCAPLLFSGTSGASHCSQWSLKCAQTVCLAKLEGEIFTGSLFTCCPEAYHLSLVVFIPAVFCDQVHKSLPSPVPSSDSVCCCSGTTAKALLR